MVGADELNRGALAACDKAPPEAGAVFGDQTTLFATAFDEMAAGEEGAANAFTGAAARSVVWGCETTGAGAALFERGCTTAAGGAGEMLAGALGTEAAPTCDGATAGAELGAISERDRAGLAAEALARLPPEVGAPSDGAELLDCGSRQT